MKSLFVMLLTLLIVSPSYAVEKATEKRLDEVAQKGAHVMPFNLELTTHIFTKTPTGGIQQVIVKNRKNSQQIQLIRQHLSKISNEFQKGNFSGPATIHGNTMPGLDKLRKAKQNQIEIVYKALADGAEITYTANDANLITAIHQWFDAQLSDHARHATSGHSMHQMHHQQMNE